MKEVYPEKFLVEYVFFGGGANKVEFNDNNLIFKSESGVIRSDRTISTMEIVPSNDDWIQFWKKIDKIDAWKWEKEYNYVAEGLRVDGDIFKVNIKFNHKTIDTFSWVKQPDNTEEFFTALKDLIKLNIQDPEALNTT